MVRKKRMNVPRKEYAANSAADEKRKRRFENTSEAANAHE